MKSSFMLLAVTALVACAGPQAAAPDKTAQMDRCKPRVESRPYYVTDSAGNIVRSSGGQPVAQSTEQRVTVPPPPDCAEPVAAAPAPTPAPADPCAEGQKHTPEQCPDLDDDGDGVLNKDDACPTEEGIPETKGCPAKDADGDGVPDHLDRCPNEAGPSDNEGCPRVVVQKETKKVELREKVQFATGKALIEPASDPLLDDVAKVLNDHSEIKKVLVEGHTDSTGGQALNQRLSQARAEAVVKALVDRGVEASRLAAKGFGPSRPIASNDTAEGREANRRVEISIADMAQ